MFDLPMRFLLTKSRTFFRLFVHKVTENSVNIKKRKCMALTCVSLKKRVLSSGLLKLKSYIFVVSSSFLPWVFELNIPMYLEPVFPLSGSGRGERPNERMFKMEDFCFLWPFSGVLSIVFTLQLSPISELAAEKAWHLS